MPPTIEIHPAAVAEAKAAREWYAERSAKAAAAFMAEIDLAMAQIQEHPERWRSHRQGERRYLLKRFPFLVVYRRVDERIQVLAVAHARRRPGYWRRRKSNRRR